MNLLDFINLILTFILGTIYKPHSIMGDESNKNDEPSENGTAEPSSPDVQFAPLIELPELVPAPKLEEEEETLFKMRAKLYRMDREENPPEWKERGLGDLKIFFHPKNSHYRLVMRREQTLKICANHVIQPEMTLVPMKGSEKAFVWFTNADYSDEELTAETLAARFGSKENATAFKTAFEDAVRKAAAAAAEDDDEKENVEKKSDSASEEEEEEASKGKDESLKPASSPSREDELVDKVSSDLDKLRVQAE